MRIAIYDLGSTSFHALVVDADEAGGMERVYRTRSTLHLAAAAADGHLPDEAAFRALRAVHTMRREIDVTDPDIVIATATSALRDASNGDHLIERLEKTLRMPIDVLDGETEATLAFKGAVAGLELDDPFILVADLGGGSLDIATGSPMRTNHTATFALGASRMTARHIANDPPTHQELEAVERAVNEECATLFERVRSGRPPRCVLTGGTARAIGRIATEDRRTDDVNGLVVPTGELVTVFRRLARMSTKKRTKLPGVQAKRAEVLPVGALILSLLAEGIDTGSVTISEWGLREGLVLSKIEELNAPAVVAR